MNVRETLFEIFTSDSLRIVELEIDHAKSIQYRMEAEAQLKYLLNDGYDPFAIYWRGDIKVWCLKKYRGLLSKQEIEKLRKDIDKALPLGA